MKIHVQTRLLNLPHRINASDALELYRRGFFDGPFLLMAKDWRVDPLDDDYEELTPDELDDEDFSKTSQLQRSKFGNDEREQSAILRTGFINPMTDTQF